MTIDGLFSHNVYYLSIILNLVGKFISILMPYVKMPER
jgi:hypothetical protein